MKTILMISALVCAVASRPQFLTNSFAASPYAFASSPIVTYEQNIIADTDPAPAVRFAPIVIQPAAVPLDIASQYHSQDEFGQFAFGHASLGQAHQQTRDFTGAVRGSYTYVNPDGEQVVANYIADAGGFRVSSNALPVAPTFDGVAPEAPVFDLEAPVFDLEAPVFNLEQVANTEEVAAAIAEHFRLVEEHKALVAAAQVADEVDTEATVAEEPVIKVVEEIVEPVTEAVEAVAEEIIVEQIPVVEILVEEAAPVVPAPLDAEGNVIDTDEVAALTAEHFRLREEQIAALAAAVVATAEKVETEAPVSEEPTIKEVEVIVEPVSEEEEDVPEEIIEAPVEEVVPAPLDAEGNVIDTDEVSAVAAEHFRLIEEHNAAVAAALAAATL